MRVFKYLLVLILLVLAGAGVWLWRLPAATAWQQVQPRMPAVGLSGIGGTVWDGHADGISVLGHDLGKIHWQVPKWPALTGTPGAELRIDGGEVELAGRVERVAAGRYDVHELRFRVPAARLEALFGAGDVQLQGTLAGTLRHASFAGLDLRQLAGAARWSDVGVRTVRGELQLADLLGEFATQPDGTVVGTFRDDGSGALVARFVYGSKGNVPEYMVRAGVTYRVMSDHLGSPRALVDVASGTVAWRADFDAWGIRTLVAGTVDFLPFGFAGGLLEPETGLTRFGARDYDPVIGRWTGKDPVRFQADGTNLYVYATAEPINLIDIDGRQPVPPIPLPGPWWLWLNPANPLATPIALCIGASLLLTSDEPQEVSKPKPPPASGECSQKCLPYLGQGKSYVGTDGHTYKNDLGGAWAFQRCYAECMGTI